QLSWADEAVVAGARLVTAFYATSDGLAYTGAALAATAGILTTRYGRLVLSALRGQPKQ
ncbi:MAG: hypothetical protein JWO67_3122, partial [Streptosporangiaceae bacterium]|nr:hypothetical protein [Streptosporangiaceae bacterium]